MRRAIFCLIFAIPISVVAQEAPTITVSKGDRLNLTVLH